MVWAKYPGVFNIFFSFFFYVTVRLYIIGCIKTSILQVGLTKIGSPEANIPQDIQLVGSHILAEHCIFKNTDGVVTLEPSPNALCYVNGRKVKIEEYYRFGFETD